MHILVIPSFFPSNARPVVGTGFKEHTEALKRAGHKVGVIVAPRIIETIDYTKQNKRIPNLIIGSLEDHKEIPVYRMHWGWFPRVFPRLCGWLHAHAGFRVFEHYCKEHGTPDIIQARNTFYAGYMASRIKEKYHIPVVLSEHSSNFMRGRVFLPGQHAIAKYTLNHVDFASAVGLPLANKLQQYNPPYQVQQISNIVNTTLFNLSDNTPDSAPFKFAIVCNLIPLKGLDILLHAFAQMFKGKSVTLNIGGTGYKQDNLQSLANSLNISEQVTFLGRLTREQVSDLFQHSHVIVSSSYVETFGITLIEAMACGKPVVATRSGGPQGFVTKDTGILVNTGDVNALAIALKQIQENYDSYNPQVIRDYCVSEFSEKAIIGKLESIYQTVIDKHLLNINESINL